MSVTCSTKSAVQGKIIDSVVH